MSSQVLLATKQKGVMFHFKLPEKGLSLRSVRIAEDGLPELHFDAANCRELPTLTEEDVATVARVVNEGKRPEFFYMGIFDLHPFTFLGRAYKNYCPQYLRGTSVGDLLSEADWSMKCLHVGTRSNESKTKFWSWQKESNLDNLAVHMDFPRTGNGSVIMSCDHVTMEEKENEIFFTEEPKMRITVESSPMYSEYITTYYNSVAFYDEPLFLKMQELMKLIVAMEWMKEKGIVFNDEWQKSHTEKPPKQIQTIDVPPYDTKEIEALLQSEAIRNPSPRLTAETAALQIKIEITKETPSGIEHTMKITDPANPLVKEIRKVRTSYNDYDFLLEGSDCQIPLSINTREGKPIIPDVTSWNELYGETVPKPIAFGVLLKNEEIAAVHSFGGITTQNIPVKKPTFAKTKTTTKETVSIPATVKKHLHAPQNIPQPGVVVKPPISVPANTFLAECNKVGNQKRMHGSCSYTGQILESEADGRLEQQTLKQTRQIIHEVGGMQMPMQIQEPILPIPLANTNHKNTSQHKKTGSSVNNKQKQLQSSHEKTKMTKEKITSQDTTQKQVETSTASSNKKKKTPVMSSVNSSTTKSQMMEEEPQQKERKAVLNDMKKDMDSLNGASSSNETATPLSSGNPSLVKEPQKKRVNKVASTEIKITASNDTTKQDKKYSKTSSGNSWENKEVMKEEEEVLSKEVMNGEKKQKQLQASSQTKTRSTKEKTLRMTLRESSSTNEVETSTTSSSVKENSVDNQASQGKSIKSKRNKKLKKRGKKSSKPSTSSESDGSETDISSSSSSDSESEEVTDEEKMNEDHQRKKKKSIPPPPLNIQQHTHDDNSPELPSPTDSGVESPPENEMKSGGLGIAKGQAMKDTDMGQPLSDDSGIGSSPDTSPPLSPDGQQPVEQKYADLDDIILQLKKDN